MLRFGNNSSSVLDTAGKQEVTEATTNENDVFGEGMRFGAKLDHHREQLKQVREFVSEIELTMNANPAKWYTRLVSFLDEHHRRLNSDNSDATSAFFPEVATFLSDYISKCRAVLEEANGTKGVRAYLKGESAPLAEQALHVIHKISHLLEPDMIMFQERVSMHSVTAETLCKQHPTRLRISEEKNALQVYSKWRNEWFDFPLPNEPNVYHKGGCSRVLNKILSGAPDHLIEIELPPNDFDAVIVDGDERAYQDCVRMGVDKDGIETVAAIDMEKLGGSRDLNLNSTFFGRDADGTLRLWTATEAITSAKSGDVRVMATDRCLYGSDTYIHQSQILLRNRGMARLIKSIASGQASSATLLSENLKCELGIYWLVLADRYIRKDNAPVLLDRMFKLGEQLGQVRPGEQDIYAVLDRVHEQYPFFQLGKPALSDLGTARWLSTKLSQQIVRLFKHLHPRPVHTLNPKRELNLKPIKVSLPPVIYHENDPNFEKAKAETERITELHAEKWAELSEKVAARYSRHTSREAQLLGEAKE